MREGGLDDDGAEKRMPAALLVSASTRLRAYVFSMYYVVARISA